MDTNNKNQPEILKNLDRIRLKLIGTDRDDHLEIFNDWTKQATKALLLLDLKEHDGFKQIMTEMAGWIDVIDETLKTANSRDLPDKDRDLLLERKKFMVDFLEIFSVSEQDLKNVEKEVAAQIKAIDEEESKSDSIHSPITI